jgi:hypothetical protein
MHKFQYCMEVRVEEGKVEPGNAANRRLGTAGGTVSSSGRERGAAPALFGRED